MIERGFWRIFEHQPSDEDSGRSKDDNSDAGHRRRDIFFASLRPGGPKEVALLKREVERTLSHLWLIYGQRVVKTRGRAGSAWLSSTRRRLHEEAEAVQASADACFDKLLALAQLGMQGPAPAFEEAQEALRALHAETVDHEAGRVKNEHMRRLGVRALILALVALLLHYLLAATPIFEGREISRYSGVPLVWIGSAAGTWISFATRKVTVDFYSLGIIEEDRMDPWMRLIFTTLVTSIFTLLFVTGLAQVVIGGFDATDLAASAPAALLVGALAGLSEKALPVALKAHSERFVAAAAAARP